jgi:hypothetical protein
VLTGLVRRCEAPPCIFAAIVDIHINELITKSSAYHRKASKLAFCIIAYDRTICSNVKLMERQAERWATEDAHRVFSGALFECQPLGAR